MKPISRFIGVNYAGARTNTKRPWRARLKVHEIDRYGKYRATQEEAAADYARMHQQAFGTLPESILRDPQDIEWPDWLTCSALEFFIHLWCWEYAGLERPDAELVATLREQMQNTPEGEGAI